MYRKLLKALGLVGFLKDEPLKLDCPTPVEEPVADIEPTIVKPEVIDATLDLIEKKDRSLLKLNKRINK